MVSGFQGDLTTSVFITNPVTAVELKSPVNPNIGILGGEYYGAPAITSKAVPEGDLVLLDASGIIYGDLLPTVEISTQATIELSDDPENDNVVPINLFQQNLAALKLTQYVNWETVRPSASIIRGIG